MTETDTAPIGASLFTDAPNPFAGPRPAVTFAVGVVLALGNMFRVLGHIIGAGLVSAEDAELEVVDYGLPPGFAVIEPAVAPGTQFRIAAANAGLWAMLIPVVAAQSVAAPVWTVALFSANLAVVISDPAWVAYEHAVAGGGD